jgi:DNA repair protein RadC
MKTVKSSNERYTTETTFDQENQLIAEAKHLLYSRLKARDQEFTSPNATRDYLCLQLSERQHEVFCCLFLDGQHRLIEYQELFVGTIDGCSVYPREVVKAALKVNAAAVIFAHNHPSGVAEPSVADQRITERLKEALALLDIRVLDHFIVGDNTIVSFAERGLL